MTTIQQIISEGATIIDVRTPEEYEERHYPGATNIPVDILPRKLDSLGAKEMQIIVYCASGGRSAIAAAILKAQGFTRVTNAGALDDLTEGQL